jgi:hypothetical protein
VAIKELECATLMAVQKALCYCKVPTTVQCVFQAVLPVALLIRRSAPAAVDIITSMISMFVLLALCNVKHAPLFLCALRVSLIISFGIASVTSKLASLVHSKFKVAVLNASTDTLLLMASVCRIYPAIALRLATVAPKIII